MLCGIEWRAFITRKNAYRITKDFDLDRKIGSKSKKERIINDLEGSWIRVGKYECFFIELRKLDEAQFELRVRGSLHRFYHGNNSGFFSGNEVLAAIDGMCNLFAVDPSDMVIKSLEVGVNIPVLFLVFPYLNRNLLYHKKKTKEEFKDRGIGFSFIHEDYLIKIYQKEKHILRFEIKFTSKDKLYPIGLRTVADLRMDTIDTLTNYLLPEFRETDIRGGIDVYNTKSNPNGLTERERLKLISYSSDYYQQGYKDALEAAKKAKDRRKSDALQKHANRLRKDCIAIIKDKGDQVQQELEAKILELVEQFKNSWSDAGIMSGFPTSFRG